MGREANKNLMKQQRILMIEEITRFYQKSFDHIAELELDDVDLAKLTQILLQSRDAAILPLHQEIEKPLITTASIKDGKSLP